MSFKVQQTEQPVFTVFSVSPLLVLVSRQGRCPSCGESKWECKGNVWVCHGPRRELIHSELKWSQRHRLNSLQLGEFYVTHCELTPTFTYRFGHWEKRKQNIKKRLGETPFVLLPEAQFKSSSSPYHPRSVTLPVLPCTALSPWLWQWVA